MVVLNGGEYYNLGKAEGRVTYMLDSVEFEMLMLERMFWERGEKPYCS